MTEARAYEPGEVQIVAAGVTALHGNVLDGAIDAVKAVDEAFDEDSDEPISEAAWRTWADSVLLFVLFRPAVAWEFMGRVGVTDDVLEGIDIGFRTDFNVLKGDIKVQIFESPDTKHALSFSLGYAHHLSVVKQRAVRILTLSDFHREDFDLQVLYGFTPNDFVRLTLAPHVVASYLDVRHAAPSWLLDRLPRQVLQFDPNQFFEDQWLTYAGLNTTVMVGYKHVFLAVDMGAFYMNFTPEVVGSRRNYSGGALSLALGLSANYAF
ncbi:MAG: hypothetical protein AAGI01_14775 [Myxococcota bacterium]